MTAGCYNLVTDAYGDRVAVHRVKIMNPPSFLLLFSVFDFCIAGTVRLTNGSYSNEGCVEVYGNGQWHNVCGYKWGFKTADVICRELGYAFAIHPSNKNNFGGGSTSMLSVPVICDGSEKKLEECTFKYSEVCPHSRDVGVVCSSGPLEEGSVRLDGTLSYKWYPCGEVQVYLDGRWGGICDKRDTWNEEAAEIACRQMGFDGHIYTSDGHVYKTKQVIGSLYCTGKESKLLDCHYDRETSGCSHQSSSPRKVGVMVCCYYKVVTLWFLVKLLIVSTLLVGVPVWVCVRSGWCQMMIEYMEKNSKPPAQVRPANYQNQAARRGPVDYYEEEQYTRRRYYY